MRIGRWCMTIVVSKLWASNRRDSILIRVFTVWYRMNVVLTFEYTAMNYCDLILCPTWVNMKNSITDQQNQSKYSIDPVQISFIWAYFASFYTMAYFLTGFRKTIDFNSHPKFPASVARQEICQKSNGLNWNWSVRLQCKCWKTTMDICLCEMLDTWGKYNLYAWYLANNSQSVWSITE